MSPTLDQNVVWTMYTAWRFLLYLENITTDLEHLLRDRVEKLQGIGSVSMSRDFWRLCTRKWFTSKTSKRKHVTLIVYKCTMFCRNFFDRTTFVWRNMKLRIVISGSYIVTQLTDPIGDLEHLPRNINWSRE